MFFRSPLDLCQIHTSGPGLGDWAVGGDEATFLYNVAFQGKSGVRRVLRGSRDEDRLISSF